MRSFVLSIAAVAALAAPAAALATPADERAPDQQAPVTTTTDLRAPDQQAPATTTTDLRAPDQQAPATTPTATVSHGILPSGHHIASRVPPASKSPDPGDDGTPVLLLVIAGIGVTLLVGGAGYGLGRNAGQHPAHVPARQV